MTDWIGPACRFAAWVVAANVALLLYLCARDRICQAICRRRKQRMQQSILLVEPTRCGVCLRPVLLATGAGYHALLEESTPGMKVPHVCPSRMVEGWLARNKRRRAAFRILRTGGDPA